ncbi:MAG: PRC-barrel domain-containing protein [Rhizobacter sp.]
MLNRFSRLAGSSVTATDGSIGHVKAAFFDDQSWTIRYLAVDTGKWLKAREVLISPYSVKQPLGSVDNIDVSLTRKQVKDSPDIDTHQPVSRQHERTYLNYYAYPMYWNGSGIWGPHAYPLLPDHRPTEAELAADNAMRQQELQSGDIHLRSSIAVTGYDIRATDDSIGHVKDFIFDDESWSVRYLVVDTHNWWPGGRKVLVATHWIDRIDWATSTVHVTLTREQVKNSPEYQEALTVDRPYEKRLHDAYDRQGYWD